MDTGGSAVERCYLLVDIGRFEQARQAAAEALAGADGDEGELIALMALCTAELDGWEAAVPDFRRAAALDPSPSNRAKLANALFETDAASEAKDIFDSVLADTPDHAPLFGLYANGLMASQRHREDPSALARAHELLQAGIKLSPDNASLQFSLARYYLFGRDWKAVERAVRSGLAIEPDNPRGLEMLGAVKFVEDRSGDETIDALLAAIRADPSNKSVATNLEIAKVMRHYDELVANSEQRFRDDVERELKARSGPMFFGSVLQVLGLGLGGAGLFIQVMSFLIDGAADTVALVLALVGFGVAALGFAWRALMQTRILSAADASVNWRRMLGNKQHALVVAGTAAALLLSVFLGGRSPSSVGEPTPTSISRAAVNPEATGLVPDLRLGETAEVPFSSLEPTSTVEVTVESLVPTTDVELDDWNVERKPGFVLYTLRYSIHATSVEARTALGSPAGMLLAQASVKMAAANGEDDELIEEMEFFERGGALELCTPLVLDQSGEPSDADVITMFGCELWMVPDNTEVVVIYDLAFSGRPEAVWGDR